MKLPSVFANKIDKIIKNNDEYYHGDYDTGEEENNNNSYELKNYFDKNGYAHKLLVRIKTNDGESLERLILCKDEYVININNEKIYFKDIKSFEIKK